MPNGLVEVVDGAGQQLQELRVVAAVQRDVVHLLAGDDAADVAGLRFDLAGDRRDRDGLGDGADFELEVGGAARRGVEHDVGALDRLEAGQLDAQRVGAGRQADEHVAAGVVGRRSSATRPVCSLVAVTVAPGSAPPDASVMRPESCATLVCARRGAAAASRLAISEQRGGKRAG